MATAESIVASPESVFDIGDRITGLLKQARQEAVGGSIPGSVLARLADTVEALRSVLAFMISRGAKRLEGERAAISIQANSMASLVIDNPLQIGECFFEKTLRFAKTELQEIAYQLADGELRRRLETALAADGWEISGITNGSNVSRARLVKGNHVRLR
jgi:hypothetical protein